jgi:CTP synthase (UTP-ammonia lyase)
MPIDTPHPPRIALVGDRSSSVEAHGRIPTLIAAMNAGPDDALECYWYATSSLGENDVSGFDGVWVVPGSPYANPAGVLNAIRTARTEGIPLLGTCGGFQHVLLEFAHNLCGLASVDHAETHPDAAELLIIPLECSLFGEEASVTVEADTVAAGAMGAGASTERYFCRYGLNPRYLEQLQARGLIVSGRDPGGDARIVELADHPFYLASLFQPELSSDSTWVHPIIVTFAAAVRDHARARVVVEVPA